MTIEFLPEAQAEFCDAAEFYEGREIGLGIRFRAEISEVLTRLQLGLRQTMRLNRKERREHKESSPFCDLCVLCG